MDCLRTFLTFLLLLLLSVGCTTSKPVSVPGRTLAAPEMFSHARFGQILKRFVNDRGRVDYAALKNDPHDFEQYYLFLAAYSPDSHPHLFPDRQSRLAYWHNAYNAAVIKTVLTYYPISSVLEVKPPLILFFLPRESGFFLLQRVTMGGETISLYALENGVIRKRFADPRVHFALNCASLGCPRLPRQTFTAERLDQQLDHETRKFLAEERNLKIDHRRQTVFFVIDI